MTITVDQMVESFTHPSIPKIGGQPSYHSLKELFTTLNANAASVPCTISTGDLGWIAVTISPALPFPTNPGPIAALPPFAAPSQLRAIIAAHAERQRLWQEYNTVDRALKQQLIQAIEQKYISGQRNQLTRFAGFRTRTLIEHLQRNYGTLQPSELAANDAAFKKPYNADKPIETLYAQIEEAAAIADAGLQPYSHPQILNNAFLLVRNSGVFRDACQEWKRTPIGNHN
jgi:hypothetical protein